MQSKRLRRAVLMALVVAASATAVPAWMSGSAPATGTAIAQDRSLPIFEVDGAWPAVPAEMRLGAPSSIAIDAEDNVWVLHRPLTLPAEQDAMAAPPVVVFDTEGNFIKAWGGPGGRLRVAAAGTRPPHRSRGLRLAGRQQLSHQRRAQSRAGQRRPVAEVHAGRHVRHADRPQRREQRKRRHDEPPPAGGSAGPSADERAVRGRRLRQPPRRRVRRPDRPLQAEVGERSATRRWTTIAVRW